RSNAQRVVELTKEQDLETLRQISLLLDRENQRLITKTLELTAELARLRGLPNAEQLQLAALQDLQQRRTQVFQHDGSASSAALVACDAGGAPGSRPASPT